MSSTTTTTTEVSSVRELISSNSLMHIRPQTLTIEASLLKPNTRMYFYFDGTPVNQYVRPDGGYLGDPVVTNSTGQLKAFLDIPEATFSTGDRQLKVSDSPVYVADSVIGFSEVMAKAVFAANGTLETYQTTETTTITTTITTTVENYDPLAQSFFTYGITGGCYVTSIDLFFFSKDTTLPAWVELREMVNGYPGPKLIDAQAISIKAPADINISDDASVPTKFTFPKLIYLKQDKDYCFVVRSNSSNYNVWTSRMGEKSVETGSIVFEQPYMGSLFKSENNVTWSAEQTEDIKFNLNYAKFNTNASANLSVALNNGAMAIESSDFITTQGTGDISIKLPVKHGLTIDSKITVLADVDGIFNGIPGSLIQGDFSIVSIIDDYTVIFRIPTAVATSSGPIITGGNVKDLIITNQGSGYSNITPPVVTVVKNDPTILAGLVIPGQVYTIATVGNTDFTLIGAVANEVGEVFTATQAGAGTGTVHFGAPAQCTVSVVDGKISSVRVINGGSGYFKDPTVLISSTIGSNASAVAFMRPLFTTVTNRVYHKIKPMVDYKTPGDTAINATLTAISSAYEDGVVASYSDEKSYNIDFSKVTTLDSNHLLASRENENAVMNGAYGNVLNINLTSSNPNVSPIIDLQRSRFHLRANVINNQKSENVQSTNSSGYVENIVLVSGGEGYTEVPTVEIIGSGTGATATATISGGVVNTITITNQGTGYYGSVTVQITGGGVGVTSNATALATLSDYNSELLSGKGTSESRYISKVQMLQNASRSIRIYTTAYSNTSSNFDFYIQTALSTSSSDLDSKEWKKLNCDIERNKSLTIDQFLDYEFYLDNIEEFDVYRIKCVKRTKTPWQPPKLINYRAITLA